jgi:hypothetical protein
VLWYGQVMRHVVLAFVLAACGACGDDGGTVDAAPACTVSFDNGSCGDQLRFTGEYVDFDNDTTFCGIFEATFEEAGGGMDITAPNGRFDMCVSGSTSVAVTPSANMSQCTQPSSTYSRSAIAVANEDVLRCGAAWSGRNITAAREASLGVTLDAAKAHVFVHVDQGSRTIALAATHGTTQAVTDTTWAAGDTGHEVFFPNVDIGAGTTALTITGGAALGAGDIPLVANKITLVTVLAQ